MKYEVGFSKTALKQLKKMEKYTRAMLINWIEKNLQDCENPYFSGKSLKGNLKGQWHYRVGDYRILCDIKEDKLIILVINVGHRREVYNK